MTDCGCDYSMINDDRNYSIPLLAVEVIVSVDNGMGKIVYTVRDTYC